ncbi:MAG: long-chain-fatty-acid--CoA ligase [Pseudomonadales bacterium]|nr:long-chain-fatty-acid--CoA ligase [Pseudomonadales bacterium]
MIGNMMSNGLILSDILEYAAVYHKNTEIVTLRVEGDIHRYTYADAAKRTKKLANALKDLGVQQGDRIGTLAWNTYRHYEAYYAISGLGAITHTINPRLFPEQIIYIVNHAQDQYIFVDKTFVPLLEAVQDKLTSVKGYILMIDKDQLPETKLKNAIYYEDLIDKQSDELQWPLLADDSATALCYTSGTTGNPKGVLYSHRSTILHAYASAQSEALNINSRSTILPVVPMFHVCAWGVPYSATLAGAKIIFPGAGMDGESLTKLIQTEKPDLLLGVPTIWLGLLTHLDKVNEKMDSVESVVIGGAAAPISMIQAFQEKHDAFVIHAWGMTEMSPLGTACTKTRAMDEMPLEDRYKKQLKQGRPVFGVQLKIVDDENKELPHDGAAFGRLLVKGPWIVDRYYLAEETALEDDGWFDTGDVATLDPDGYMQIVDRKKDVIKSGGEWISSIDLENVAVGHPDVQEACVIGVAHEKWDERPILLVIPKEGKTIDGDSILNFMTDKIAKWWMPDVVISVTELPHTATGKLLKRKLREEYKNYLLNLEKA